MLLGEGDLAGVGAPGRYGFWNCIIDREGPLPRTEWEVISGVPRKKTRTAIFAEVVIIPGNWGVFSVVVHGGER
jgi:hypothetical protein